MTWMDDAHALIVGVGADHFVGTSPSVASNDARDLHRLLVDPGGCGYRPEHSTLLVDGDATRSVLREALHALAARTSPDSTVLVYLSGLAVHVEAGSPAGDQLPPANVLADSTSLLAEAAIAGDELAAALRAIPARRLVMIFDGGPLVGVAGVEPGLPGRFYRALATGRGRVVMAACRGSERPSVRPGAANSLFGQTMLVGLAGGAPSPGGVVRVIDLFRYVQPRVTIEQPRQHPVLEAEVEENFPIALHQGRTAPAAPMARLHDRLTYDAFISYRHQEPDRSWVRRTLAPRLQAEGLEVCIDYRSFRLGAPLVLEMARAVEQSRYTLAVLSPAYLTSNFTELESVLAEHLGLERSQRRLLAVLHQDCTPRLGMRARLMLDMTDEQEFDANLARLVHELWQLPDA